MLAYVVVAPADEKPACRGLLSGCLLFRGLHPCESRREDVYSSVPGQHIQGLSGITEVFSFADGFSTDSSEVFSFEWPWGLTE